MHCVDCHFSIDNHGDGTLYGEVRAATAVDCVDCHGSIAQKATLAFSGNASSDSFKASGTPFGPRFVVRRGKVIQQSSVDPDLKWDVVQVADTLDPDTHANASLAHTIQKDGTSWGIVPDDMSRLAHGKDSMSCYSCHTAWAPSCFGCHLPMRANENRKNLHNEGGPTRNWTGYNFQTLRDDVFMLGHDGAVKKGRVAPVRSSETLTPASAFS